MRNHFMQIILLVSLIAMLTNCKVKPNPETADHLLTFYPMDNIFQMAVDSLQSVASGLKAIMNEEAPGEQKADNRLEKELNKVLELTDRLAKRQKEKTSWARVLFAKNVIAGCDWCPPDPGPCMPAGSCPKLIFSKQNYLILPASHKEYKAVVEFDGKTIAKSGAVTDYGDGLVKMPLEIMSKNFAEKPGMEMIANISLLGPSPESKLQGSLIIGQ